MIAFTPTDAAKVTNNPPQGATPNTSRSGFTAFNASEVPQPVAPQAPQLTTGSAGQTILPGSTLGGNLKALPGQLLGAFGALGNAFTGGGANAVGQELGTTGANIGLLAQGKNPNIPVNIPKLAGGILASGAAVAAAGMPIAGGATRLGRVAQAAAGYGALGGIGGAGSAMANGTDATSGFVKGAIGGAVAGGLGQGAIEGIGAIQAAKTAVPTLKQTIDVISPKPTPVAGAEDISLGKGKAPTFFGKAVIDQSETPYIQKAAQDVQGLVSPKVSMIENVNNVKDGIENISKDVVKPFLADNSVPFNFEDLQTSLGQVQPSSSLKSNPSAFNTYGRVKDEIQQTLYDFLKQNPERGSATDMNNLWDARKAVDTKIAQELGDTTFNSPQYVGVKAAARDMRNAVNKFIVDSLTYPGQMEQVNAMNDFLQTARSRGMDISNESEVMKALGGQFGLNADTNSAKAAIFKNSLDKMSGMYDAISNMAPKAYQELGKTGIGLLMKQHPFLTKIVKVGLTGLGLGIGGELGIKGVESL